MNRRQWFGRLRGGVCVAHGNPITQSVFFDGGICSLGCRTSNTLQAWAAGLSRRAREEYVYDKR